VLRLPAGPVRTADQAWRGAAGDRRPPLLSGCSPAARLRDEPASPLAVPEGPSWDLRAFRTPDGDAGPAVATHKQIRVYPLSRKDDPPEMTFINAAGRVLDTIHPVDSRYFDDLAQLVAEEHEDAVDPETARMLAAIGIAKGEAFAPDERMRGILHEAATVASYMALATSYKSRLPLPRYDDRQWIEIANTGYPEYRLGNHTMLEGVSLMGWFATVSSKAMVRPILGKGSVYMWT
jgi:hypothetical protein